MAPAPDMKQKIGVALCALCVLLQTVSLAGLPWATGVFEKNDNDHVQLYYPTKYGTFVPEKKDTYAASTSLGNYADVMDFRECTDPSDANKDGCEILKSGSTAGSVAIAMSAAAMLAAVVTVGATLQMPEKPTFSLSIISSFFTLLAIVLWSMMNYGVIFKNHDSNKDLTNNLETVSPAEGTILSIVSLVLYVLSAVLIFLGRRTALAVSGGVGNQSV